MNVKIKEIPLNDRPRERLKHKGVESLSNEELLAIILKTGTKDMSAKSVASNLLKEIENINNLSDISLEKLTNFKGIGQAKACELLASIELGKRINSKIESIDKIKISNASNIFNYYSPLLGHKKQEHFYAVYLDIKNHIIKDKLLFIGTINYSLVNPREIFKEAYLSDATSFIVIHNHPSGNSEPSAMDINITKELSNIGAMMEVKLLDHIIISKHNYFSFKENGMI